MVAVLDQVQEQIKHLRLDMDRFAVAGQLASSRIEGTIAEEKMHPPAPLRRDTA
jgi:hypothetical protein